MDAILNEVELKKEQRIQEKIEKLKKEGKKPDEIKVELEKNKNKKAKEVVVCNTATDIQKRKIEKLMNDPVVINFFYFAQFFCVFIYISQSYQIICSVNVNIDSHV